MSVVANATETTGTETTETTGTRRRPAAGTSKFARMYALAGKATGKRFTLKRETEEGTISLKMDGFPSAFTPEAVAKLARDGAKVGGKADVAAAVGGLTGVLVGKGATDLVDEMTSE